jgi:hypothetical protein
MERETLDYLSHLHVSAEAPQKSGRQLRENPFTTYRDPQTGHWIVVKTNLG